MRYNYDEIIRMNTPDPGVFLSLPTQQVVCFCIYPLSEVTGADLQYKTPISPDKTVVGRGAEIGLRRLSTFARISHREGKATLWVLHSSFI